MKKLFILLCLFTGMMTYSQGEYWLVDQELMPYLKEYIQDSEDHGYLSKRELITRVNFILFNDSLVPDENGEVILGLTQRKTKGILLSSTIKDHPLIIKIVLYHELGHLLKDSGEHSCDKCYDIMSAVLPNNSGQFVEDEFLNSKIDIYFDWLKE